MMGCFDHCEGIKLPFTDLAVGEYNVVIKCNDYLRKIKYSITADQECIILSELNECCFHEVYVTNSDNKLVTENIDGVLYSTFVFQTIIA